VARVTGVPSPAPRPAAPGSSRGRRVLLADDDAISREVAKALLSGMGLDVAEAKDGLEALERLSRESFDAVLLDGEMPRLSGLETVKRIREQAELRTLPVVAMTAHSSAEDRERFLAAGMSEHVGKPIEEAELRRVLGRFVGLR